MIAATPVTDTVKRATDDGLAIAGTEPREGLWAAQTPQVFRRRSCARCTTPPRRSAATDDAMLVEAAGGRVLIEPAPAENLKLTTDADRRLAELLLAERG